jgi:hypothetical protein
MARKRAEGSKTPLSTCRHQCDLARNAVHDSHSPRLEVADLVELQLAVLELPGGRQRVPREGINPRAGAKARKLPIIPFCGQFSPEATDY